MTRSALLLAVVAACGGSRGAAPAADPGAIGTTRACPERYDDAAAERAPANHAATLDGWLAAARTGDPEILLRAVDGDEAGLVRFADTLLAVPATCAPVWYAQPARLAVQPALDDEPADPARDAHAARLAAADQYVATCDGGCAVIAIAVAYPHAIDWAVLDQRP